MPIIVSLIAKGLAYEDAVSSLFATVTGTTTLVAGQCSNLAVVNVEITPCGLSIAAAQAALAEVQLYALNYLLAGLLAV